MRLEVGVVETGTVVRGLSALFIFGVAGALMPVLLRIVHAVHLLEVGDVVHLFLTLVVFIFINAATHCQVSFLLETGLFVLVLHLSQVLVDVWKLVLDLFIDCWVWVLNDDLANHITCLTLLLLHQYLLRQVLPTFLLD